MFPQSPVRETAVQSLRTKQHLLNMPGSLIMDIAKTAGLDLFPVALCESRACCHSFNQELEHDLLQKWRAAKFGDVCHSNRCKHLRVAFYVESFSHWLQMFGYHF